ncbi:Predicted arabinose efflux permease, MFS family [Mucilaginibacter lappiensis]|uniref:MFS family arabinose efflux permease n=1 Tax=Mucilaginibacter lappiensis TaxID=354630 RepID=A0ABR6PP08_9SPHI|nr:MFS transporter [Mucilaginibacter lappiensis]MBB6111507.1 putative MFS family arabinose efflux permease [Mucilaginibacter lappiensis]SIR80444.1 Predicted arabinose efflux permease, MFS family [Mucilaginibacter lappiensis]
MTVTEASKEHPHLTPLTLWIMTIATGLVVANIYYNQPLLADIAHTFGITDKKAQQLSLFTQIGYACGLLFIVPLADMVKRKQLILLDFILVIFALLISALAPSILVLTIAGFLLGLSSIIPQLLIPMAAHLAKPHERGKKLGFVMSGLLIGILLSRTLSGFIGQHFGWRSMYYIATGLMAAMWLMIFFFLPEVEPDYKGNYKKLMTSLIHLIKTQPKLRMASFRGALCFAGFSAFWTTLVFLLKQPQFNEGSAAAGAFGLVGAFGALAAGLMGRLSDKMNPYKLSGYTLLLVLISYVIFYFSSSSIAGLIIGVIVLDMGVQATHISNQSIIFALIPEARNRLNTVYMVSYFVGGASGTFLASLLWNNYGWTGVCAIGGGLALIALAAHFINYKANVRD